MLKSEYTDNKGKNRVRIKIPAVLKCSLVNVHNVSTPIICEILHNVLRISSFKIKLVKESKVRSRVWILKIESFLSEGLNNRENLFRHVHNKLCIKTISPDQCDSIADLKESLFSMEFSF